MPGVGAGNLQCLAAVDFGTGHLPARVEHPCVIKQRGLDARLSQPAGVQARNPFDQAAVMVVGLGGPARGLANLSQHAVG